MSQWIKNTALVVAGVLGGVLLTVAVTASAFMGGDKFPAESLQTFTRVFAAIKRNYVEPVEDKKLIAEAINGMLSHLDPHSAYFDAKEFKQMNESIQGEFGGVGMQIETEDGYIKVQSPIEGGPAERAGIRAGDLIVKIGKDTTKGVNTTEAVKKLRGEPNTSVTITVSRKGDPIPMVITLKREIIKIASVRSKSLDDDVGYVRVIQFQERTTQDLVKELNKIGEKGVPKHLVLDLRNNPGGTLNTAVGVSAAFLPANELVVSIRGRELSNNRQYFTKPEDYRYYDRKNDKIEDPLAGLPAWAKTVPMVVLINAGSASASEIVAGALRDYKRAKIVGVRSFGKGSVQNVIPLSEGTGIKLTTQRYYTPKDISIQAKGIEPEFNVDETPEGNLFAEFIRREGDNENALDGDKDANKKEDAKTAEEKNRESEERFKKLEKLRAEGRKPVELGSDKDYQLQQAVNVLLGKPVITSKPEPVKAAKDKTE